ncbi:hypothetical protein WH47_09064 [Habropoda laboriosa]|uniref:Uncharacterized protein n=1 Tax=Habropoda laboriosa TaxID=597456 RepID=A0A0L7QLN6_9HYME|nr:PREDICTED: uncharacterized protein LOC108577566 [Habropoda laboriosa]KOC59542.1 hypothetical protein WH47_09064 [Habropoda laboriosa]
MFRSIAVVLFTALPLLQAACAIDISQYKNVQLEFNDNDGVPRTKLLGLNPEERGPGFIGDLVVGQRYSDETIFRRVIEFENPTSTVQGTTLSLSISNGVIHYISARNAQGSYGVICDNPNVLGASKSSINLRVPPNSTAMLSLIIAAHSQVQRKSKSYMVQD